MELKIYSPQEAGFIQKIDWNFEELKEKITAAAQEYETYVYTDDTIKAAKADRAKLNKFVDALNDERTEIRKKLLKPDELFGQQVKELTGIVKKAISNIDSQVNDYEERLREEKTAKVREFYEGPLHGTIYHDDHEQYQILEDFKGKIWEHTGHNAQCQAKIENPLQPELLLQPVKVFFILIAVLLEHMHIIPHGVKICRDSKHDRYQHTYDHFRYASIIPRNCAGFSRKEK